MVKYRTRSSTALIRETLTPENVVNIRDIVPRFTLPSFVNILGQLSEELIGPKEVWGWVGG